MDIRVIETIIASISFLIIRFATLKIMAKVQSKYNYSKYRIRPILKFIILSFFFILVIILIAVWGVEQANVLTFIASFLTVVGIALVAQWSILSNISSALIIIMIHPVKLGENIIIIDKEFDIKCQVSDILGYVINERHKIELGDDNRFASWITINWFL